MVLWNDVWNSISSPNELLINFIFIFFIIFIENPLSLYIITSFFDLKLTKIQKLIYISITSIIAIFSLFFIKSPYNIIINYIFAYISIKFIFKLDYLKSFFAAIFPGILFSLVGNLIFNPFLTFCNISYDEASTIPLYRIPFALIMYLFVFILVFIMRQNKFTLALLDEHDKKTKRSIILNLFFCFIYLVAQLFFISKYIDILPIGFTLFMFLAFLVYILLSFLCLTKISQLSITSGDLHMSEEYNKTLKALNDQLRCFKHDYSNTITTIGGFIKNNDIKGLENYYNQMNKDFQSVKNLDTLNPDVVNNSGVYALLSTKYHLAEEKNIDVNLSYFLDLSKLPINMNIFCRVLGILLDNAIEAAEASEEKKINIIFRREFSHHRSIVLIENSYLDKSVDTESIFYKGISGKENHSGLGLWEVKKILEHNKNLDLYTTKTDNLFSQQFEIYDI